MDAPKCKLCQKRHYGSCAIKDIEAGAVAEASGLPVAEVEKVLSPSSGSVLKIDPDRPLGLVVFDKGTPEVFDICPACGTNLAAQRKSRERRRVWMKRQRAAKKGS